MRPLTAASAATMSVAGDVRPAGGVARNVRPATDAGAVVGRADADENLNHASRSRPSTRSMYPPTVPAGMPPWKGMEKPRHLRATRRCRGGAVYAMALRPEAMQRRA